LFLFAVLKFNWDSTGANAADNASSNGPLNRTLSKCLWKASNFHINADNMQIGCGGHVVNISCQYAKFLNFIYVSTNLYDARAIYFGLGCADDPNVDDYYHQAHGFPMVYSPDEDPEVVEEMRIAKAELKAGADDVEDADQDSSSEDSTGDEGDEDGEGDWVDVNEIEGNDTGSENQPEKQKRRRKMLSCVDKVCVHRNPKHVGNTDMLFSFMQSSLIFFAPKLNARRYANLSEMSAHPKIDTSSPSVA
jgi:hypothetical protein